MIGSKDLLERLDDEAVELTDEDVLEAFEALRDEMARRGLDALTGGWDYRRRSWGRGHIQFDPKVRHRRDGSIKVHGYWYFHYIVGGKRKSTYIGKDARLASWMAKNPPELDAVH
ncbi:MAG: hypothetical protein H0T74_01560 [Rubrobacteraceae bacterium]|jgi:hypothetical protein|nr:hypothetical protein [Rubrobacteraceae bacterium]